MYSTKSGISLVSDTLIRAVSTTAILFVIVAVIALLRGVSQDVHYPLASDDWYLVAGFLSIWCFVPALLATLVSAFSKISLGKSYMLAGLLQVILLYGYSFHIANQPGNELGSSPLMLLVYLAIPVAAVYYPLFFVGRPTNRLRLAAIVLAALLLGYVQLS
ncbi:MAG: hypothetical protein KKE30_21225 [Gammaproteobacteria bacterium]|nr:hypothetical protein [Gammaproteobacteria bacterium]MBU1556742.1 hypothetical protein [Gammaproteobacteria bacterium]MBU2070031.1 hypothetical protein [Gammaproteobacteria bacterium]MBU2183673.1 hypothetical protein [Gammaproteobacteria bacterium]MBU2205565.1 hypothetical protein [Gammaproteobacteria bacterium]